MYTVFWDAALDLLVLDTSAAKRLDLNLDQTDTSSQPTKVIVAGHASSALAVSDGSEDLVVLGYGVESTRPESESR